MFQLTLIGVSVALLAIAANAPPEYIKQCRKSDPQIIECYKQSLQHLSPYLAKGIPSIEMPSVEPFIMDTLDLQLTDGPQGYKISMKNIEVFGASNYQVKSIKLSENDKPFEATIIIPKLSIETKYTSSGVLLIIPASGGGDLHGVFQGVTAHLLGKVSTKVKNGKTYLHVDHLNLDLDFKSVKLSISNVLHNNQVLTDASNLFLRENGLEVAQTMRPQLQKRLSSVFGRIANQLLKYVAVEDFLID
ncbi:unnamed protein product [Hermetia illucens]|uniref:Uncharacterized protein n=1 Tax=Hermetia illucens TaxID=343691 RepID=A0A7R8V466_HERIL|nr:protein takeout-like [Hermetia illucens]CAD7091845.1 unnamed protein product [Hermetia illucens]